MLYSLSNEDIDLLGDTMNTRMIREAHIYFAVFEHNSLRLVIDTKLLQWTLDPECLVNNSVIMYSVPIELSAMVGWKWILQLIASPDRK